MTQALDKIRFLALTDDSVLGEGDDVKLEIYVRGPNIWFTFTSDELDMMLVEGLA